MGFAPLRLCARAGTLTPFCYSYTGDLIDSLNGGAGGQLDMARDVAMWYVGCARVAYCRGSPPHTFRIECCAGSPSS